jgi:hypothetical protein
VEIKAIKKAAEVKVWQWKGYNHDDRDGLKNFLGESFKNHFYMSGELYIHTYNCTPTPIKVGDYIVKDIDGRYYPIPSDVFETLFKLKED